MDTKNSTQKTKREDAGRSGVPRSKIPELRREQILEAALKVFALKGADGATNQDIAKETGLASPGLIYHYFQDRNDLLKQVIIKYHPLNRIFSGRPADQETDLYGELLHIADAA
ncbi:helix-turn-helix transcriptional regulator, partial [bacterium]|nr:helix-turn-helix transcriptional regulator [bacterium]